MYCITKRTIGNIGNIHIRRRLVVLTTNLLFKKCIALFVLKEAWRRVGLVYVEIGIHFELALSIVFDGLSFVKPTRDNWRIALMPFLLFSFSP